MENLRVIYDVMKFTEEQKIPGLIMLINFEKAFDSLSWNFLHKCLKYLNFGESIRQWIKVFYKDVSSAVIQSGKYHPFLKLDEDAVKVTLSHRGPPKGKMFTGDIHTVSCIV